MSNENRKYFQLDLGVSFSDKLATKFLCMILAIDSISDLLSSSSVKALPEAFSYKPFSLLCTFFFFSMYAFMLLLGVFLWQQK